MNIAIRVDSSFVIGSGHVIRCLILAEELKELGANIIFVCRDHQGNLISFIKEQNYTVYVLPMSNKNNALTDYKEWVGAPTLIDAKETIEGVLSLFDTIDVLIVDHYGIDCFWEREIRTYTKNITVIDDFANRSHNCDLIIDPVVESNLGCTRHPNLPDQCIRLFGPKYAFIGKSLHKWRHLKKIKTDRKTILLYLGRLDNFQVTRLVVQAFKNVATPHIQMKVIIPDINEQFASLKETVQESPNITLNSYTKNLPEFLARASLVVGGCGITSFERIFLRTPSLGIIMADNQKLLAHQLQKHKVTNVIGTCSDIKITDLEFLLSKFCAGELELPTDATLKNFIDGKGAERVALEIVKLVNMTGKN